MSTPSQTSHHRPGTFSPAPFTLSPRSQITCPVGENCSCRFSASVQRADAEARAEAPTRPQDVMLAREVKKWRDLGFKTVSRTADTVVLERRRSLSLCVNGALTVITGFIWLAWWIPSARHPKIDTRTVHLSDAGEIVTTSELARR